MNDKKQWSWYWMPVKGEQHYVKDVTLCFYDTKEGQSYQNIGPCIMDDFGELVSLNRVHNTSIR